MKRRITSILVVLSMALSMIPFFALPASAANVAVAPANVGTANVGTADNPYKIASAGNLVWFVNNINSGAIPNTSHADVTNSFTVDGSPRIEDFRGVFDGRNHTLNMGSFSMLFKTLQGGGIIRNLHIRGNITLSSERMVGGIVGYIDGATISNCSFVGNITAWDYIGHIAGLGVGGAVIENCWSSGTGDGTHTSNAAVVSGIVSANGNPITVRHCWTDRKTIRNRYPGTISGYQYGKVTAYDCYATGPNDATTSEQLGVGTAVRTFSYTGQSSFSTSDYSEANGWKYEAGMKHPIFKQYIKESAKKRILDIYDTDVEKFNLTNYFDIILAEDKDYNQDGRFTYSITENHHGTITAYNEETDSSEQRTVALAEIDTTNTDLLKLDGSIGVGNYKINIKAEDTKNAYDSFDIPLEIRVHHRVPVPQVLAVDLSYSRQQTLAMIPITEGWDWDDITIVPKDINTTGYKVHYPCKDWVNADNFATYYDLSSLKSAGFSAAYDAESNSVVTMLKVDIAETEDSPRSMKITVLNADYPDTSSKPIPNATITCEYEDEFPEGHVTDASGQVYAEISPGRKALKVTADGYYEKTETVEILGKPNTNAPIVKLVPKRTYYKAADVREKGTDNEIPNAVVSIAKISEEPTLAWNNESNSMIVDALTEFNPPEGFPDGRFQIKSATYGWSHDDVIYMKVADGEYKYYTDARCTALATDQEAAAVLHASKLDEPTYDLKINKAEDGDAKHYIATLKLLNINATYGTFAIAWNTDLFTFNPSSGFHAGSAVAGKITTAEKMYLGSDASDYNALGSYGFLWSANDRNASVIEAELTPVEIATFDFYLKDASLADMLTVDSFSIKPWQEIKAASDWAAAGKAASSSFDPKFWEYWRDCDTDNVRSSLKTGRIDATKSIVNGVETNGFFQAAVNGQIGDENPGDFYDIMTDLQYGFPIKNSVIRFHVTDLSNGDDIGGAKIKLFDDTATKLLQSDFTSNTGRASFTSSANKTDPQFAYEVTRVGYWPVPASGLDTDRPFVSTVTGKATEVGVQLERKIYHLPIVAPENGDQLDIVGSSDLGGEKYAYNGREYNFRIKGAKGYRITKYPNYAYVSIGDENAGTTRVERFEIEPDKYGIFTVPADLLMQDALSKEYMDKLAAGDAENGIDPDLTYAGVKAQPDDEGFRSYNVIVQFDQFEVVELEYLVEGMTNEHGTVKYNKATKEYADGNAAFFPDAYVDDTPDHDIKVKTQKTVKNEETKEIITPANHRTGTFTFVADDGYYVERVYINGLQTDIYDDLTTFNYTFGDVDMDCSIIVMFYDGETPSTDTVLTLVVGDYGFADVSKPVEETGDNALMCTRRTYLNPTENLEFTTRAFSEGHELYMVERELEGERRVNITDINDNGKYSIAPVEAKNVIVYVTFKNKMAEITPSLFVKSYVFSGQGVADPAGILIYNIFDSVKIDLIADADNSWRVWGVRLSPYEDLDNVSEFEFEEKLATNTYRYDSLTESITIASVFMEKAYPVTGVVDLSQKANVTTAAPLSGATIKFVRLDEETKEEIPKQVPFVTDTTATRKNSTFSFDLPAGWWNVYVMKQGYVTYKITGFKMDTPSNDADVKYFGKDNGTQQVVVPLIGSTQTGDSISLTDARNVKSGMRGGVSKTVFEMTDVDNNNSVDYIDLAYVWKNYNARLIEQTYEDFCRDGSKDIQAMTAP